MPNYLTPGVYVEEIPARSKPIEGVGTSTAAFVGLAPGGPINTPMRISNWTQFAKIYGDPANPDNGPFMEGSYLAHSLYGYFANGGSMCWVVRVGKGDGAPRAQAALPAAGDTSVEAYRALAKGNADGEISIELTEEPTGGDKADSTYKLVVTSGSEKEEFDGLSLKKGKANIATKVNAASKLIKIEEAGESIPEELRVPASGKYALSVPSIPAGDLDASDFEGDVARRQGLGSIAALDEVTMLVMPDAMTLAQNGRGDAAIRDLQGKMIAHCEGMGDRMVILDAPPNMLPQDILDWRMNTAGYDSKYAALYYPWIEVMDPLSKSPMMIPPSGHVAGIWARTDTTRGVHKAPANEVVLGANGLAFQVTAAEQGGLNQNGINCIRAFPGRGIRVWGARTMSSDPEWRYVNVRRLFNYVSESIMRGTQWAVFEPNDQRLWMQLKISTTNFLTRVWRDGALFGSTPQQAFYVKCDAETNPPDVVEAGQVVVEVGIAPVKPAEFVIFRISQFTGGGEAETAE
ncbi:MAG TPA: phage tail sheath subtilisin-like domain-containing protein [Gaiellaceae bacterium]|nr:phage tail sheath subtilisin-like domain-containing protein [Gaiellaceae bacterium]